MALGFKTGGRTKGTPNKRTVEVIEKLEALGCDPIEGMARLAMDTIEKLEALGCDPIEGMARLAMDTSNPPELRGRMFAELAQYVAPKRKALEVDSSEPQVPVIFNLGIGSKPKPADQPVEGGAE